VQIRRGDKGGGSDNPNFRGRLAVAKRSFVRARLMALAKWRVIEMKKLGNRFVASEISSSRRR
jgi:hypothetical protein